MNKILSVVTALLPIMLIAVASLAIEINVAVAAENPEHFSKDAGVSLKQKRAEKVLLMMKSLGISDPDITAFIREIDGRSKNGHLLLSEEKIAGGTLSLRYALEPKISAKQIELLYAPENSNTEYSVRTNSVMMNYKLKF
jgi:hypothetical protein